MRNELLNVIILIIIVGGLSYLTALDETSLYNQQEKDAGLSSDSSDLSGYFLTIYGGRYTDRHLLDKVLMLKPIYYEDSWMQAIALGKNIYQKSSLFRLEVETQFANHIGEQKHYEFNVLFVFRLLNITSNFQLPFSLAFGNGLSYATEVPKIEERSRTNLNASRLLNYLLLEIATDLPSIPNWEIIGRIHHRSGVFGLFNNVHGGSNIMTIGLRYFL